MKSCLPVEAYIDADWFAREQALLFRPLWQFVAPRALLSVPNAFVTADIAGIAVLVQNVDGTIVAMENRCLHRHAPLQTEPHGVRTLACRYHGWRYGADGSVTNVPHEATDYRFDQAERCALKLRCFAVHEYGGLVFVNVADEPLPFDAQFALHALGDLAMHSEGFDSEVLVAWMPCRMNWKLAYENLRDGLHPRFLHGSSLYRDVRFDARIDEAHRRRLDRLAVAPGPPRETTLAWLRAFSSGGRNAPLERPAHAGWHAHVERRGDDAAWYLNWLMYPNLHIASANGGHSFIIEHHRPVAADHTELVVYYVTARRRRAYDGSAAVLMGHLEAAAVVLGEDVAMMEQLQQTLRPGMAPAVTGQYEYENLSIERWYLDVMEGRRVPG